ncbi:MAG: MBL fold metallo-hydrolase [Thermodesulfovibrionales bacterium]|jgi:metallo-beta-lactamase family protein
MEIRFFGAARKVTGSCFHLSVNGMQLLVDCGMNQGEDGEGLNKDPFPFLPSEIECLFLTHAHIDHSGLIPKLVKDGFRGRIITTPATADLSAIMLADSAQIQEKDAQWLIKKALRAGRQIIVEPLYTVADAEAALSFFEKIPYGKTGHLGKGVKYRFLDAGHILGSGTLEIWYQDGPAEKKIVFSGDVGRKGNPIINDPQQIETADYVVVESTYGDRLHKEMKESIDELVEAITTTFRKGGNCLIPSFAVGRTQDLLYTLNRLVKEGRLPELNVYVDSPLAEEATKIYLSHPECFDEEALRIFRERTGDAIRLHFTTSVEESQKINAIRSGAVIIAGSGMCDGGRIRHHFKHNLWRPECSIIFVGFQVKGTLGRQIVDGAKIVSFLGEEVAVKAAIYTIGGFSAHADKRDLLQWLGAFANKPEVFIVHGEEEAALSFEKSVQGELGFTTHVPAKGDLFII